MYKAVEKYEEELAKVNAGKDGLVIYGDIPKNVAELGAKLIKGKSTDIDKSRALYDFFWQNCSYEFYSGHVKSAEQTLNDLAGNCMDLANLYKSLAESVKLACEFRHANSVQFSDGTYAHWWCAVNVSGTIIGLDVSVACDPYNKTSTSKINQMFGFGNMEHPYPHSAIMVATTM
jgi:transglutaminase-like putative cysteine protease